MSIEIEQVEKFYQIIWNRHDKTVIPDILTEGFQFRGSLGQTKTGHAGFSEYLDMVHFALKDFKCVIEELVSEPARVFAKMHFSGVHTGTFLGYKPTGKLVSWPGAALFKFNNNKISDLWVLGDVKLLEQQLLSGSAS